MENKLFHTVYSFDNGYAQQAGLSILSLLDNNKDIVNLKITVIDCGINETNRNYILKIACSYNRQVSFLPLDDLTHGYLINTNFNKASFGRIFIPNVLTDDVVYYIDSDTIINGSLSDLQEIDMTDYLVAGTQDTVNPYYLTTIGLNNNHRYINTGGVLVMNLKKWRDYGAVEKCIEFIDNFDGNPPHYDQGTINKVCTGFIFILPPTYNVMPPIFVFTALQLKDLFKINVYYNNAAIAEAKVHPLVIHYTTEFFNRPWFTNCTHPLKHLYLEYKAKSPWANTPLTYGKLTLNCKIQNLVLKYMPYPIYKLMIRFVEFKHRMK